MRKILSLLFVVLFPLSYVYGSVFEDCDIIFHTSRSSQSKAIQLATKSKFSHVGIIVTHKGVQCVFEAVQPVKYTPVDDWIKRGKDAKYCVKRLKSRGSILTKESLLKFNSSCDKYAGKNYDLYFNWSDDTIYCSELIWKVFKEAFGLELSPLRKLKEFELKNKTVKKKLSERYGNNIPMDEPVVAPSDLFDSKYLETIECK